MQGPSPLQTSPAEHCVVPQLVDSQPPFAQRYPAGQTTPKQSGEMQVLSLQISPAGHGVVPQVVDGHWPPAQSEPAGQTTPTHEVDTQLPP